LKRSKTIQFLSLGLIPVGIVVLIFSIKLIKKTYSGNVILEIPYNRKSAEFILDKPGNYAIWHKGQFFRKAPLDEFKPEITELSTGLKIKLSSRLFRPNANNGRNASMEIFRFSALTGKYMLELKKGSSISGVENSMIGTIPAEMVDYDKYFIQVRESQPRFLSLAGIVLIVLGVSCITGGLVFGILSFSG
jgi:hypothetical protein